jgi:hypothetical protein
MISRMALLGSFGLLLETGACAPASAPPPPAPAPISPRVSFQTQIRPMLEGRCQPCHFAGGKMYERLPFDRPETIRALGERLFSRIKDEQEQALLRSFFAQGPEPRSR